MRKSISLPSLREGLPLKGTAAHNGPSPAPKKMYGIASLPVITLHKDQKGVTMDSLMAFLFPEHLSNPESSGRLDLFAHFGPCDDDGLLHGGWNGHHIHTDLEIKHMITELNREELYRLLSRPRDTVTTMVNELLPKAVGHHYTRKEIMRLFNGISPAESGRYDFLKMQNVILADQNRRILTLIGGGEISKSTRRPIPHQTKPGKILTEITTRKKLRPNEEIIAHGKRLHGSSGLIAPLEQQNLSEHLRANVALLRPLGDVDDHWDRYCAIRKTGKISYVGARNSNRRRFKGDDDLADKAPMCSTLTATISLNGPLNDRHKH